jgi:hypothetical protein
MSGSQTIDDAGGWQSDTVVEDMDLSLRAHLKGWGAVYLPHVGCSNEVPDRLSTYKTQQYRWAPVYPPLMDHEQSLKLSLRLCLVQRSLAAHMPLLQSLK